MRIFALIVTWWAATVATAWAAPPPGALEFCSVAEPAVLYDGPSQKATPLFIMARQTPVEVVVTLGGWLKVRDASGGLAWLEKRQLSEQRTLLVTAARAQVRNAPSATAPLVFEAEREVVLELMDPAANRANANGWVKVRHRDGQSGFIRVDQVWGL